MIGTPVQSWQLFVYICSALIATVAVGCRLWARKMTRKQWQPNDYMMLVAYILLVAMFIMAVTMVTNGELGVHKYEFPPEFYADAVKYDRLLNWVMSIFMTVCTSLVKMSITEFYLHLFPQGWLHIACYVQLVALAAFMVAQVIGIMTICRPIAQSFRNDANGQCGDVVTFWLAVSIIALVFDVTCVVLPMPIFWRLRMSKMKRLRLTVLFGLGFCICGLTGLRVYIYRVLDYSDPTYAYANGTMLTTSEPALGILAGCLPIMSPCFVFIGRRLRSHIPTNKSKTSSASKSPKSGNSVPTIGSANTNPFRRLEDHMYPLTEVKISRAAHDRRGSSTEGLTDELETIQERPQYVRRGIKVHREVLVDSEKEGKGGDEKK